MNSFTKNDRERTGFSLHQLLLAILIATISISCAKTRSISNSGYHGTQGYRGELSELEVLGVNPTKEISDADIQSVLASETEVSLKRGDRIVLVQSGATFPDEPMLAKSKYTIRWCRSAACQPSTFATVARKTQPQGNPSTGRSAWPLPRPARRP